MELKNLPKSEFDSLAAIAEAQAYKALRQQEYPPITDYLDAIVKGDQDALDAYVAACKAVKDKYPKPEGN